MNGEPDKRYDQLRSETLQAIFDFTKAAPDRQIDNLVALDTKVVQIFQAASVVIGLAGLASNSLPRSFPIDVLLICALIYYIYTALIALLHLRPRRLRRSLQADWLWPNCWNWTAAEVRHAIAADASDSYLHNKPILDGKAENIRLIVFTAGMEVLLVGLALILSRFA